MEYIFFFAIIFGTMINFTMGAIRFSSINRTLSLMYKGLLEASTSYVDSNGFYRSPYFDKDKLKNYVINYMDENLKSQVDHYTVSIYYFDRGDETMCLDEHCESVRITLKADINYLFHFEKAKEYHIVASNNL